MQREDGRHHHLLQHVATRCNTVQRSTKRCSTNGTESERAARCALRVSNRVLHVTRRFVRRGGLPWNRNSVATIRLRSLRTRHRGCEGTSPVPVPWMWWRRAQSSHSAQSWQGRAQSWSRCGRGQPSPGADVAAVSPVPVQMWQRCAQSRCRCGRGEPSPMQMWQGRAQSWSRCGSRAHPK